MTSEALTEKQVVTVGESMALFTGMATGPLRHASTFSASIAGSESNVAIGLSRACVPVRWIGRVGDDEFGQLVLRTLRAESVDTSLAIVDAGAPTGLVFRERRTADLSRVVYYRADSAGSRLNPNDVRPEVVESARLLHVTGITSALSDSARETVRYAVEVARTAGVPVSMDVNYRSTLWSEPAAREECRRLLPQVDVLFAGAKEATVVLGHPADPVSAARSLREFGPSSVVVKNGAHGSVLVDDEVEVEEPAPAVKVVDTVGAGDALVSGFLAAWLSGASGKDCLRRASLTSGFSVSVEGDWEGLPTKAELDAGPHEDDIIR